MIIVFYRDKNGKIIDSQSSKDLTLSVLCGRAQSYNQVSRDGKTAHVIETSDDSLTAFLFDKAMERKKWDRDDLQDAIGAIESALEAVRGLLE